MRTSFSTLACPDWSLSKLLRAAATYGYDGVELRGITRELDLWKLPQFKSSSLTATRGVVEDHGLVVPCIGSSARFDSSNLLERRRNLDSALRMAEVAAGLGASAIRVFGDRIESGGERSRTAAWIADSLTLLADKLKWDGVQVWLETHGDFAGATEVSEILARLANPEIGIIWDPANAFEQTGEPPLLPPSMLACIQHVHVKDLTRGAQGSSHYVPTGEGEFPFDTMFACLDEIAFRGFVSFEWEKLWHPELDPPEIALPHFIQWWKRQGTP